MAKLSAPLPRPTLISALPGSAQFFSEMVGNHGKKAAQFFQSLCSSGGKDDFIRSLSIHLDVVETLRNRLYQQVVVKIL